MRMGLSPICKSRIGRETLPTFNKSKYKSMTEVRNNPNDDLELEYQRAEVQSATEKLYEKFKNEPKFYRQVALELAKRMIETPSAHGDEI
jgi:hypothetical protein